MPERRATRASVAPTVATFEDYVQRNLHRAIDYSAWPIAAHTLLAHRVCGRWPRYVVGVSSAGAESMHVNYDFAAAAKAVLETLVRYLSYRLLPEGARVNAVRTRLRETVSFVVKRSFFSPPQSVNVPGSPITF